MHGHYQTTDLSKNATENTARQQPFRPSDTAKRPPTRNCRAIFVNIVVYSPIVAMAFPSFRRTRLGTGARFPQVTAAWVVAYREREIDERIGENDRACEYAARYVNRLKKPRRPAIALPLHGRYRCPGRRRTTMKANMAYLVCVRWSKRRRRQ